MKVIMITRGDKENGMGHVARCRLLADTLRGIGADAVIATPAGTPGADWLKMHRVPMSPATMPDGDVAVIDLEHGPDPDTLQRARKRYGRVVVVAGSGFTLTHADAARELSDLRVYQSIIPTDDPAGLSGAQFMMVRPDYARVRPDFGGHILLTMAGADPHGLTAAAAQALRHVRPLKVVIGPAMKHVSLPPGVRAYRSPDGLVSLMQKAALVVCPLGMTAYEAAAAGVPALLTAWTEDHGRTAEALEREGTAQYAGLWDAVDWQAVKGAAQRLLARAGVWRSMSAAGRGLVDGFGAERVARAVMAL